MRAGRGSVTTHVTGRRRHEAGVTPDANTLRSCVMRRKGERRTHGHTYGYGGVTETPRHPPRGRGTKSVVKVLMAGGWGGRRGGGEGDVPVPVPRFRGSERR